MNFTAKTLAAVCASTLSNADRFAGFINAAGNQAGLNTLNRVAMFCAQISVESGKLSAVEENLNYSLARIPAVWPSRFPTLASAAPYARNPKALANKVYNGRMGNATGSDDGWIFRGRGLKQLTGRSNYTWMSKDLGIDFVKNPELVAQPQYAVLTAVRFWTKANGNIHADADDLETNTRAINGGLTGYEDGNDTGLDDRVEMYDWAKSKLLELGPTVWE